MAFYLSFTPQYRNLTFSFCFKSCSFPVILPKATLSESKQRDHASKSAHCVDSMKWCQCQESRLDAQPKLGRAVGIKFSSAHNLSWLLWHWCLFSSQSTSKSTAQTSLRTARCLPFKNVSSPCLLNCATQRETRQSKAILTCTSFLPLAQKGRQTIWVYTKKVCRTGKRCCHHFTDEETSHKKTSNFPNVTLQVSPKTGKGDKSFNLHHYDQIARPAAERIQTDSQISDLLWQSLQNTLQCLLIFYDKNVAQSP